MRDLELTAAQRLSRLDCYRLLIVEAWRRQRITNKDMASRLGRSLSLTNKLKAGATPLTGPLIDQFVMVLGIDSVRAFFAVNLAHNHMSYFDPKFQSACSTTLSFFENVLQECGYSGFEDLAAEGSLSTAKVDIAAQAAAATLAGSFLRAGPTGQGVS